MAYDAKVSEQRVVDEFVELVRIDSPSHEEAAMAAVLEARLSEMGFVVANDRTGPSTGNLVARLAASSPGGATIALNAHTDTVQPGRGVRPVIRDGAVWSSGDTVLGADCKASIAAILEGIRAVQEAGAPLPNLELLLTWGEEGAHTGAKALDTAGLRSAVCFTLDAAAPVGTVITSAPAYHAIKASFRGRAAHAGVSPESGINALVAASRAIARMPLGRIDEETTANIGLIRGGTGRNTVPELVEIEGEARSRDNAKLAAQIEAMTAAMREEAGRVGTTLELTVTPQYQAYSLPADSPAVVMASKATQRLGLPVRLAATGGGSDANEFNVKGLPSVVLGSGMVAPHTLQEHIAISDLVLLSRLVVELIAVAAEEGK